MEIRKLAAFVLVFIGGGLFALLVLGVLNFLLHRIRKPGDEISVQTKQPLPKWIQSFENDTQSIFDYVSTKGKGRGEAYKWLAELVDDFGPRQTGSESLEKAIDFNVERLRQNDFDNVHTESVPNLPKWVRGEDTAEITEPRLHKLTMLTIGGSPSADVNAEAITVGNFEELEAKNANGEIQGKIVVFTQPWEGYGISYKYRFAAVTVEKMGGVGLLVKSIAPLSVGSPHTGSGNRGLGAAKIPAACITIEEADMLERWTKRGKKIRIRMKFTSKDVGTVTSRNTVFEITGSKKAEEVVLLSCHFDSWDVGQGAVDDGGGCAAIWHALYAFKQLGFRPKRTIRVVFFTAEEQGYLGAEHYYESHANDSHERVIFACESDSGAFRPLNWRSKFSTAASPNQTKILDQILFLINKFDVPLFLENAAAEKLGDVQFWAARGVPAMYYEPDRSAEYYFYFHHTEGDYMTVLKDGDLEYTTAIFATLAHVIANADFNGDFLF